MGILLSEGWTKASRVPIPLMPHLRDEAGKENIMVASLDVDEWICCPTGTGHWSKHVKVSRAYALIYYSSTSVPSVLQAESGIEGLSVLLEMVSDILFLKIRDQAVVDIDDEDVVEVGEIELML